MIVSILEAGADPTGKTPSTEIIQSCIDRAAESGGKVLFPSGRYLSGGLILRSRITLEFEIGSELAGIPEEEAYSHAAAWTEPEEKLPHRALLLGEGLEDITLTGPGTINGQGELFPGGQDRKYLRPFIIYIRNSRRVRVQNLHLKHSGVWMQSYELCQDVHLHGLRVDNISSHCNDGIDIVSSSDVIISDCKVESDDDALCFKTHQDVPCERIVVTNCLLSSHCNAFKIGTDSYGDFRDISVSNCIITPPKNKKKFWGHVDGLSGILLSSMDGARIENINFSNITISGTRAPILLRLGNRGRARGKQKSKPAGVIRGIHFNGLRVRSGGCLGLETTALPGHCIEELEFTDFNFEFVGGGPGEPEWAAPYPVPEVAPDEYPDPGLHGIPPSWGLFARRVRGLRLRHGNFATIENDDRPPIIADDVTDLQLVDVRFPEGIQESVRHVPQGNDRPKTMYHPSITPRLMARYEQNS